MSQKQPNQPPTGERPAPPPEPWPPKQKDSGGPAFPRSEFGQPGMSLRDYFAAAAMQAWLMSDRHNNIDWTKEEACRIAYSYADAMIKERDK